jgi:hypothetical protein
MIILLALAVFITVGSGGLILFFVYVCIKEIFKNKSVK